MHLKPHLDETQSAEDDSARQLSWREEEGEEGEVAEALNLRIIETRTMASCWAPASLNRSTRLFSKRKG